MISWFYFLSFLLILHFFFSVRVLWWTCSLSGWIKPSRIEGSSWGSYGNHDGVLSPLLTCGTLIRIDVILILMEVSSSSASPIHCLLLSLCFILFSTMKVG
ncbi:unnamed protein product (mitochondrion) [Kudoa iwatai]|uniref:Uncharacterized protein n=1 Tax=Kudoa iwatai TaxID=269814 RepID=A0A1R3UDD2_9CNID|nr:unnamed protein product [Kudoa iwatai]